MSGDRITRREFMRRTGQVSAGLALGCCAGTRGGSAWADSREGERPNILFCIADDWAWPHAGVHGDKVVKTPTFDRLARDGMLFNNAFCAAPTCTASRGAVLSGQTPHRLREGANLMSILPADIPVYPDILEDAGYHVGYSEKGWSPGNVEASGRKRNPAGPRFGNFDDFLKARPDGKPFCYWFGSFHPHRAYEEGSGVQSGMNPDDVSVPPFLPDAPEVRSDILDYYYEVQQYDTQVGEILGQLEEAGLAENTIVVMTSDNGMPFPRAKATLYEAGNHMPLVVRWPGRVEAGGKSDELIGFTDFAPTFLEAAGIKPPKEMTGRSFLDLLLTGKTAGRDEVFFERERHANVRKGDLSYPSRAVRTHDYLYIRNFEPDRWPAGDPEMYKAVGPFGDIDGGPTKSLLLDKRDDPKIAEFFRLACGKRPAEELFDLKSDPWTMNNLAGDPKHESALEDMRKRLESWMKRTADPRAENPHDDRWDKYTYYGW